MRTCRWTALWPGSLVLPALVLGGALVGVAPATGPSNEPVAAPPPSAEFLALVPDPTALKKVATGLKFVEGPIWLPGKQLLAFSDIPADVVYTLAEGGKPEVWVAPSRNTNGTTLDREGWLLMARHTARDVARLNADGTVTVLAATVGGKRFNSPNDLVVTKSGDILFTDPPYGVKKEERELTKCGVYRLTAKGEVTELTGEMPGPNGLALSPDEKILYVADSSKPRAITAFDFDGEKVTNPRKFYATPSGVPDGIRVDREGNVWTSAGDGVHVVSPGGKLIGVIAVPESPANLCFGGAEGKTLFITARTSVHSIKIGRGQG